MRQVSFVYLFLAVVFALWDKFTFLTCAEKTICPKLCFDFKLFAVDWNAEAWAALSDIWKQDVLC